jgi:pilus assembly protein Flp/PilA
MIMYIRRIADRRKDDTGASAVEYGLLVAAVAAIIILLVFAVGSYVKGAFQKTCTGFSSAGTQQTSNTANANCNS